MIQNIPRFHNKSVFNRMVLEYCRAAGISVHAAPTGIDGRQVTIIRDELHLWVGPKTEPAPQKAFDPTRKMPFENG